MRWGFSQGLIKINRAEKKCKHNCNISLTLLKGKRNA